MDPDLIFYLIIFSYSLSFPLDSLHLLYMTDASTLAGLKVLGSLSREITLSKIVLTFWVGFQRSQGSSPDWGSSIGGCRILIQRSPFLKKSVNTTLTNFSVYIYTLYPITFFYLFSFNAYRLYVYDHLN